MDLQYESDRETSREAAESMRDQAQSLRERVLIEIVKSGQTGLTDDELQRRLGIKASTECPRRIDLVNQGLIVDSGRTRLTGSNRRAIVWIAAQLAPERIRADVPVKFALERLGFETLDDYYESPLWTARRDEFYVTHEQRCAITGCGSRVDLHHISYARLGNELDEDLIPISRRVHDAIHHIVRKYRVSLSVAHLVVADTWLLLSECDEADK